MSSLIPVGARPQATPALPAAAAPGGKAMGAQLAPASGNLAARLPVVDPVSLQNQNVSLSTQSLARTSELAVATVDAAQQLMDVFVNRLFGDQAKGATYSFDSVALEAQSSFSASASQSASAGSLGFSLNESASFLGKGQLVTADGQTYEFEIEIAYEARIEASAAYENSASGASTPSTPSTQLTQSSQEGGAARPDSLVLTGKPLPAIKYPGTLDDLFKLLGKELSGAVSGTEGEGGNLTLRLLRLVDQAALLAPRLPAEEAVQGSKAAGSYAAQAGSTTQAA